MNQDRQNSGAELLREPEFQELIKYAQIIPAEMLQEMQINAEANGVSLEVQMASLLLSSFVDAKALGIDTLANHILNYTFSNNAGARESKQNRQDWLYLFELKKLELFLEFKPLLPRKYKETFSLINAKEETKRIQAEKKEAKLSRSK